MKVLLGIDVGGTFTDLALYLPESGDLRFHKLLTSANPTEAILNGAKTITERAGLGMEDVGRLVHGTTLVANALIERKGAAVGLLTTEGFRDVLEIGDETRYDHYDLFQRRAEPLVPRRLRRTIHQRIDAEGYILAPVDPKEVRVVVRALLEAGIQSLAIAFLHSYRNPDPERDAMVAAQDEAPGLPISLSSEVAPEIREFERTSTTVADAYVRPVVGPYIAELQEKLRAAGVKTTPHVMLSNGGFVMAKQAARQPVQIVESGPAGAAAAAALFGSLTGASNILSFDMGGTTAKMCFISGGQPKRTREFEVARVDRFKRGSGLPLRIPSIELLEIGAGGGSIASVSAAGLITIGPESAGSRPGPACYGLGGDRPTVTDADLVLGFLGSDNPLGGSLWLDAERSLRAFETRLSRATGLTPLQAAQGVHSLVNDQMARAALLHAAERALDPARYTLVALGGSGPLHAYGLARHLKIRRIVVPRGAGIASAIGFLVAPLRVDLARSWICDLPEAPREHIEALYREMEDRATSTLLEAGATLDLIAVQRSVDLRFAGQGYDLEVEVLDEGASSFGSGLEERFRSAYRSLFERDLTDTRIEAVTWRLHATAQEVDPERTLASALRRLTPVNGSRVPIPVGERSVHFPGFPGPLPARLYERVSLTPGHTVSGPALVVEDATTTVVGPSSIARIDDYANIVIELE